MYVTVRRYKIDLSDVPEVTRLVEEEFIPILRQAVGFIRYVLYVDEDNRICSISSFMTRAGMEEANEMSHDWAAKHLVRYLPLAPEVSQGESRLYVRNQLITPTGL